MKTYEIIGYVFAAITMCILIPLSIYDVVKAVKNKRKDNMKETITIGTSDYSRKEMEQNLYGWGTSSAEYLKVIKEYENDGYEVEFKTSLFRKIFCMGIYKVTATKNK